MGDEKRFHQLQEITLIDARNKTLIFIFWSGQRHRSTNPK